MQMTRCVKCRGYGSYFGSGCMKVNCVECTGTGWTQVGAPEDTSKKRGKSDKVTKSTEAPLPPPKAPFIPYAERVPLHMRPGYVPPAIISNPQFQSNGLRVAAIPQQTDADRAKRQTEIDALNKKLEIEHVAALGIVPTSAPASIEIQPAQDLIN